MTGRTARDQRCDLAIVGGGLAGGLIALALRRARPELALALVEGGDSFGGNHRWSWFEGDLGSREAADLLAQFPYKRLAGGYSVHFPDFARHLDENYRSLSSRDFDAVLRRELPQQAIRTGCTTTHLAADGIHLASGEFIAARAVIDCRDFVPSSHLTGGWQLFVGHHLRTSAPHGLGAPIIMDADVAQHGAYRFVYSLPLSADEVFVEDTYYTDTPILDRRALAERIAAYAGRQGWDGALIAEEAGVLPVVTGGDGGAHRAALTAPCVALAGARGLFSHPLTSYTLPFAAANALAIAQEYARSGPLDGRALAALMERRFADHWRRMAFYRSLGRMLFQAAEPEERWRVFARFYRLPAPLIERFYAGRSTIADRLRVVSGKPPVPFFRAVSALLGKGAPLVQ